MEEIYTMIILIAMIALSVCWRKVRTTTKSKTKQNKIITKANKTEEIYKVHLHQNEGIQDLYGTRISTYLQQVTMMDSVV